MENIKFSFIIPAYNSCTCILNCLNSILTQTYKNFEILVIDDCSKDNTYEIVKNLNNDKIKLFSTQKNSRQGAARNIGIKNCTGDYILFVDSDDSISDKTILKKIYDKINLEKNPDILYLAMKIFGKNNLLLIPDETNTKKEFRLATNPYINSVSMCIKSSLIKNNNIYFPEKIRYEDVYFAFLIIEKANSFSYLEDIYYIYDNHENSTTTTYTLNQASDTIKLIEKLFELYNVIDKKNYIYLTKRIEQQKSRTEIRLNRAIEYKLNKIESKN